MKPVDPFDATRDGRAEVAVAAEADAPDPDAAHQVGDRLGRYELEQILGRGGMGVVYLAADPELGRKVAIKVMQGHQSDEAAAERQVRLLREAQAMAKVSHPNLVTIYDVGTVRDRVFIAMEYLEGSTLRAWLAGKDRDAADILRVFAAAGQGLAAAHEKGLVHRDFKPDNVMIRNDGLVQVLDFGLARPTSSDAWPHEQGRRPVLAPGDELSLQLTQTGSILGTPAYMAPEQFAGASLDARSDQFSFCVALYEALTGALPFGSDPVLDLMRGVIQGDTGSAAEVRSTYGKPRRPDPPIRPVVWDALQRGLAIDPSKRFEAMRDLLPALAPPTEATQSAAAARGRGVLWGAAIVATAVLVGALVIASDDGDGVADPAATSEPDAPSNPEDPTVPAKASAGPTAEPVEAGPKDPRVSGSAEGKALPGLVEHPDELPSVHEVPGPAGSTGGEYPGQTSGEAPADEPAAGGPEGDAAGETGRGAVPGPESPLPRDDEPAQ